MDNVGATLTSTYVSSSVQLGAGLAMVADRNFVANNIIFSGLTGNYIYQCYIAGQPASAGDMRIEVNGDSIATDYYRDEILGDDAALTGVRANDNSIGAMSGVGTSCWDIVIGNDLFTNSAVYHCSQEDQPEADLKMRRLTGHWVGSAGITSLKIYSTVGFSGRAILYRLGEK